MVHPVQSVIESLYAAGRCPRLHVNAIHANVICPEFIREQWKERLIIDLDANYPLDLAFEETGLSADLSFGGYVTRCSFPWDAIYVVADRATGRGIVLDRNMPASIKAMRESQGEAVPAARRTKLRSVPMPAAEAKAQAKTAVEADAPRPAAAAEVEAKREPSRAETQAKKRRAAFKVIDGGG